MCLTYANLNDMTFPFLSSIVLLGAAAEVSLLACPALFLLNANKIALVHLTAPIKNILSTLVTFSVAVVKTLGPKAT